MQTNKLWVFSCTFVNVFVPLMIVCSRTADLSLVFAQAPAVVRCALASHCFVYLCARCTLRMAKHPHCTPFTILHSATDCRRALSACCAFEGLHYPGWNTRLMAAGQLRFKCLLVGFAKVCISSWFAFWHSRFARSLHYDWDHRLFMLDR